MNEAKNIKGQKRVTIRIEAKKYDILKNEAKKAGLSLQSYVTMRFNYFCFEKQTK